MSDNNELDAIGVCADCLFSKPLSDEVGECRVEPPKVFAVPVPIQGRRVVNPTEAPQMGIGFQPVFPQVSLLQCWCGAFEPRGAHVQPALKADEPH